MCSRKSKIMSLNDKVRFIHNYQKLSPIERKQIRNHAELRDIIINSSKIITKHALVQKRLQSVKNALEVDSDKREVDINFVKISLLEKIIVEWYLRYNANTRVKTIKNNEKTIREKCDIARHILNLKSFIPSRPWYKSVQVRCFQMTPRPFDNSLSLGIKEITKFILEKEGISKEEAQSKFEIHLIDENEVQNAAQEPNATEKPLVEYFKAEPYELNETVENECSNNCDADMLTNDSVQEDQNIAENEDDYIEVIDVESSDDETVHIYINFANECPEKGNADMLTNVKKDGDADVLPNDNIQDDPIIEKNNEALQDLKPPCERIEKVKLESNDEDNSDIIINIKKECIDDDTAPTNTSKSEQNVPVINNNQDALDYLKPLRSFFLAQNNLALLEILTKMEHALVKPEK